VLRGGQFGDSVVTARTCQRRKHGCGSCGAGARVGPTRTSRSRRARPHRLSRAVPFACAGGRLTRLTRSRLEPGARVPSPACADDRLAGVAPRGHQQSEHLQLALSDPTKRRRAGSDGIYRPVSRLCGTTGAARDLHADPVPRRRLTEADGQLVVSRGRRRGAGVDAHPGRDGRLRSGSVTALATGRVRPRRGRDGTSGRRRAGPEPELPEPR
jgi:hypothetical protein